MGEERIGNTWYCYSEHLLLLENYNIKSGKKEKGMVGVWFVFKVAA